MNRSCTLPKTPNIHVGDLDPSDVRFEAGAYTLDQCRSSEAQLLAEVLHLRLGVPDHLCHGRQDRLSPNFSASMHFLFRLVPDCKIHSPSFSVDAIQMVGGEMALGECEQTSHGGARVVEVVTLRD